MNRCGNRVDCACTSLHVCFSVRVNARWHANTLAYSSLSVTLSRSSSVALKKECVLLTLNIKAASHSLYR